MRYRKSLELYREACERTPGGTHCMGKRPHLYAFGARPIYFESAEGCRLIDVDGHEYIDLVGALGPNILGYRYPSVDAAVKEQLRKGVLTSILPPLEVEVAELLCDVVPGCEQVRFFKTGNNATAAAARVARAYTGRTVLLNSGYRGTDDMWAANRGDPGVPECLNPLLVNFPFGDLEAFEQALDANKGEVAAVFLEVFDIPENGYLQAIQEMTHRHDALFVLDEVKTAFRVAVGGVQERYDVRADMVVTAKGMANGYPLAALCGSSEVMKCSEDLVISGTYYSEALSLAAAKACILEVREKQVPEYLWRIGERFQRGMNQAAEEHGIPFKADGLAPIGHPDFEGLEPEMWKTTWDYVLQELASRGVYTNPLAGVMTYSHTEEDIDRVVDAARGVFAALNPLWNSPDLATRVQAIDYESWRP